MISKVLTVSQVNTFIKSLLEGDGRLRDVFICGEISNFTDHYKSGHLYFSLKDEKSVLKAVMFSGAARGLKFKPADGMKVIIRGRVSVYEASGQYQLYAQDMQPDGIGALSLAFEQLKQKLEAQGLFAQELKKPLPPFPKRIAVITSPTGAAVQDILQITKRRWPPAEIILCPVLVQGDGAARQLTEAVRQVNAQGSGDVIIIGRGGGSLEDLAAFNDETLAREIAASTIPVVSAVGHETDFTICDFVADLRAPTPSAAAELCTPDIQVLRQRVREYGVYFRTEATALVEEYRQELDLLLGDSPLAEPRMFLAARLDKTNELQKKLETGMASAMERRRHRFALLGEKLDALSPLKVLVRGYAVVQKPDGSSIQNTAQTHVGEEITVRLSQGRLKARVTEKKEVQE